MSLWTTTAVNAAGSIGPRPPFNLDVAEPVEGEGRLPDSPRRHRRACSGRWRLPGGVAARRARRAPGPRHDAERPCARAGPDTRIRTRPTRFWPKSRIVRPLGEVRTSRDRKFLVARTSGRAARDGIGARLHGPRQGPPAVIESGTGPVLNSPAGVEGLARVDAAGPRSGPSAKAAPLGARWHRLLGSVGVLDHQLCGEARLLAVERAAPGR